MRCHREGGRPDPEYSGWTGDRGDPIKNRVIPTEDAPSGRMEGSLHSASCRDDNMNMGLATSAFGACPPWADPRNDSSGGIQQSAVADNMTI